MRPALLRAAVIRLAHEDARMRPYLLAALRESRSPVPASRRPALHSDDLSAYPVDAEADDLSPEHREEISGYELSVVGDDARQAVEIARKVRDGIAKGADICKLNAGVCRGNLGIPRHEMPQVEGEKSVKEMLASDDAEDRKKGEAMVDAGADPESTEPVLKLFLEHLRKHGVGTSEAEVPVGSLYATQSEIKAEKVYGMADSYLRGDFPKITESVVVSRDNHILDGHHRWAALLTIDPDKKMSVLVVDMDMADLLKEAQAVPGVYAADFDGKPLDADGQRAYKAKAKSKFDKAATFRAAVVRLAHINPALRPHLLPLLVHA